MNRLRYILIAVLFLSAFRGFCQYEYPELMVTPRASERIKMEANNGRNNQLLFSLPMTASAAITMTAGIMQFHDVDRSSDEYNASPYVGVITGGAWLFMNYWFGNRYGAYRNALKRISKLPPAKTKRQKLIRERMAEEELNELKSLARKLMWSSVGTNLVASIYMASQSDSDGTAKFLSAIGALAAISPVFFSFNWIKVAKEQHKYKKRIYGPVSMRGTLLPAPGTYRPSPGLLASMSF